MKKQLVFALLLSGLIVGACSTESAIPPNDSNSSVLTIRSARVVATNPLIVPIGWSTVQTDKYVRCFKKTVTRNGASVSDYIVVANLKQGATVGPLYTNPTPAQASTTTPNPSFVLNDVLGWWNATSGVFAVSNASFFNLNAASQLPGGTTTLPFVLKHSGVIRASGANAFTESNQRWIALYGTYATITDGPGNQSVTNVYTSSNTYYSPSTVLGGLHPLNADKGLNVYQGRTMVGIKDCDGDGLKESIYVLTTTSATQQQAYDILRNEFACDQTIMFDGSGSSQMKCKGTEYVKSTDASLASRGYMRRNFPVAFIIKASATAE